MKKKIKDLIAKHPMKTIGGGLAAAGLTHGYFANKRHDSRMKNDPEYRKADKRKRAKWSRESNAHDRRVAKLKSTTHGKGTFFSPHKKGAMSDGEWYDDRDIKTARGRVRNMKLPKAKRKEYHYSALGKLFEFGSAAWTRKEGKRESGGLNQKGVESYRRANPGSKLKTAVTRDPSKLKKGGKSAKRRASFCARMKGMKRSRTSAKTANDPNSRINKSLRAWNC